MSAPINHTLIDQLAKDEANRYGSKLKTGAGPLAFLTFAAAFLVLEVFRWGTDLGEYEARYPQIAISLAAAAIAGWLVRRHNDAWLQRYVRARERLTKDAEYEAQVRARRES